jgi:hypothetical protein
MMQKKRLSLIKSRIMKHRVRRRILLNIDRGRPLFRAISIKLVSQQRKRKGKLKTKMVSKYQNLINYRLLFHK